MARILDKNCEDGEEVRIWEKNFGQEGNLSEINQPL